MIHRLRAWLDERRRRHRLRVEERMRRDLAMSRAVEEFQRIHKRDAMGAHVLRSDGDQVIVRVMYMTNPHPTRSGVVRGTVERRSGSRVVHTKMSRLSRARGGRDR